MLNTLKKVNMKIQEKKFDFLKDREMALNMDVFPDHVEGSLSFIPSTKPFDIGTDSTQIKILDNILYITSKDGYMYYNEVFDEKLCDYRISSNFDIGYVDYNGAKSILVVSMYNSILYHDYQAYKLPFLSTNFAYAYGRIFYIYDGILYYTKPFDYFGEPDGVIKVSSQIGEIRKVFYMRGEIYVFYEKAIIKIPTFSNSSELKIITVPVGVNIPYGEVLYKIDECIYYLEYRTLVKFNGTSLEKIDTCLPEKEYPISPLRAGEYNGEINILTYYFDEIQETYVANYMYTYNTRTHQERFVEYEGVLMPWISGIITKNGQFAYVGRTEKTNNNYTSKSTDLSVNKIKTAYSICAHVSAPTEITVTGDFGEKKLFFNKGYNEIFCNFDFYELKINVYSFAENYVIKDLIIKFTTID